MDKPLQKNSEVDFIHAGNVYRISKSTIVGREVFDTVGFPADKQSIE
jgi:hypothetical protein